MATVATIIAIILGPILAVQVQKMIERLSQRREEKRKVLITLLTTRGRALAIEHVQALNGIPLFFEGRSKKDKAVVEAWDVYRDSLFNGPQEPQPKADGKIDEAEQERFRNALNQWGEKNNDYLTDLLKEMAGSLGYHFPDLLLKRGTYKPRGHGEIEYNQMVILDGLARVLQGQRSLPMSVTDMPVNEQANKAVMAFLEGKQTLPIRIEDSSGGLTEVSKTDKSKKS